jgi:hypothetical protein
MELEVPQNKYLKAYIYNPLTWYDGICNERGKRGGLVEKAGAHGKEMLF